MIQIISLHAMAWCKPCQQFAPVMEAIRKEEKYNVFNFREYDIDTDEGFEICEKYHVRSVPTTLITEEDGEEIYKIVGATSKANVEQILDSVLKQDKERQEENKTDNNAKEEEKS